MNTPTGAHTVSVVIPTVRRGSLAETEAALAAQTRAPDEVIVVEDGDRQGPSWARNEGVRQARGDVVAFTDDDCVPGTDWLERFLTALDGHRASMVSSHYREVDPFLQEIRERRRFPAGEEVNPTGFVGVGGNVLFTRSCLEECRERDGFIFNPVFGSYASEDIELAWRLRRRGHRLVFIPNVVTHLRRVTPAAYLRHQFNRGIGLGILYRIRKRTGGQDMPDRSLLWGDGTKRSLVCRVLAILWKKAVGPFDRRSFSTAGRFAAFWLGEKAQSLGFLYALLARKGGRV
jgi:GT2 family glycosyltransferase